MGRKKSGIIEKINEGSELGKEATDRGTEINGEGSDIKGLLDSMDTDIDEDDISEISRAEQGYKRDFSDAFSEQAEVPATDAMRIESDAGKDASMEQDKVEGIRQQFEQMHGISDIGRDNASHGADAMKQSSKEYGEFMEQAQELEGSINETVREQRSRLDGIFG